jgi:translation initiation factor 2 alpha subunit (eIF-2alpha)
VDPRKFQQDTEYLYAQKIAWAYGQAYSDLLELIEAMVDEAEHLTEKEQGKVKNTLAEAMS